jgi:hypothetical protein
MRLLGAVLVLAAVVAAAVAAGGSAAAQSGFAFGRFGGNIRPYTVTIGAGGAVHTSGPVTVGQRRLIAKELAALRRAAAATRFTALPAWTHCAKTHPDVASTFIRVGARTVRVHGSCVAGYTRFWLVLSRAVGLSGMA